MDQQIRLFEVSRTASLLRERIISKMRAERSNDLSNNTIERVFEHTCLPTKLIACAKELRDCGVLTVKDITGTQRYENKLN